jgi:hypothetical protein
MAFLTGFAPEASSQELAGYVRKGNAATPAKVIVSTPRKCRTPTLMYVMLLAVPCSVFMAIAPLCEK